MVIVLRLVARLRVQAVVSFALFVDKVLPAMGLSGEVSLVRNYPLALRDPAARVLQ